MEADDERGTRVDLGSVGLPGVDTVAKKRFRRPFMALTPAEQDEVLAAL
jgi:hypothetical protein